MIDAGKNYQFFSPVDTHTLLEKGEGGSLNKQHEPFAHSFLGFEARLHTALDEDTRVKDEVPRFHRQCRAQQQQQQQQQRQQRQQQQQQ